MRTPCFVYDLDVVTTAWHGLSAALEATGVRYRVAYAIKVNPLRPILAHLRSLGADAEIVSLRELRAARAAGFQTDRVIVNGPMKPPELLSPAGRAGAIINLESRRQLEALAQAGTAESGQVGLRLAPDDKAAPSRFGFSVDDLPAVLDQCRDLGVTISGFHVHHAPGVTGAGADQWSVRATAVTRAMRLEHAALAIEWIDWGGGLRPPSARRPTVDDFAQAARPAVDTIRSTIGAIGREPVHLVEPGRFLVEHAGSFHTVCVDVIPRRGGPTTAIIDGGVGLLSALGCWQGDIVVDGAAVTSALDGPAPAVVDSRSCLLAGPMPSEEDVIRLPLARPPRLGADVVFTRTGAYHHAGANQFYHDRPHVVIK